MPKDLRTIVKMFLIAATISYCNFGAVSDLDAARFQDESENAIQLDEADFAKEPAIVPEPLAPIEEPVEDTEVLASPEALVANSGAIQILTKESFTRWINPLIFLLLVVSLLCWLLALMSPKPTRKKANEPVNDKLTSSTGENIGRVFDTKPDVVDDLTKIGGIESHDARRLNEAGIWQYDQLRNMTAQQRANLQRKLNLPHIRWYSLAGLSDVSTASVATDSKNSLTASEETAAIRLDSAASSNDSVRSPKFQSQTGVKATEAIASAAITSAAITSAVEQGGSIANLNQDSASTSTADGKPVLDDKSTADGRSAPDNSKSMADSSSTTDGKSPTVGKSVSDGRSAPNNSKSTADSTSTTSGKSPVAGKSVSDGKSVEDGKSIASKPTASASVTNSSRATDHDDLTRLAGVDADAAARLNAAGIYKFDQLKDLDDQQASQLAEKCRLPNADISDWRRCIYAWGRGIDTISETDETFAPGSVHGIELPQVADGVFDGEKLIAYPEQVIFRGANPEGWGRAVGKSIDGVETSLSCDSIRSNINYLRIRRTDTRESVVVPMTKGQLFSNGDPNENGWNGSSEVFFGGRHIGVFAQHLPQEVETKFSQGGWGFGHRYDHNDRQEWGWAGRVIEPTSFEISVGCIGDTTGTVVFRGSDPSIWNTKSRDGDFRFANPVDTVKHPVNFVRIMREATGEAVIVRVDGNHVLDEGFDPRCGWNGSCSEFSGGQHLGVYHCDLAQDFETRFEFGGWGFGHPYNDNDRQAWGWAGRQLPETVFEISLLEAVPDFMQHELVG